MDRLVYCLSFASAMLTACGAGGGDTGRAPPETPRPVTTSIKYSDEHKLFGWNGLDDEAVWDVEITREERMLDGRLVSSSEESTTADTVFAPDRPVVLLPSIFRFVDIRTTLGNGESEILGAVVYDDGEIKVNSMRARNSGPGERLHGVYSKRPDEEVYPRFLEDRTLVHISASLNPGQTLNRDYIIGIIYDDDRRSIIAWGTYSYQVASNEIVEVPLGRIEARRHTTVDDRQFADNAELSVKRTDVFWHHPSIGKVRQEVTVVETDAATGFVKEATYIFVLRSVSYDIPPETPDS